MSIMDGYGHLTSGDFEAAPMAYYLHRGCRITLAADNEWRTALEGMGAVEVTADEYKRADALEGVGDE